MTHPTSLSSLLTDIAVRRPDQPALCEPDRVLTWAGADQRAGRLAAALAEVGVGPGDRVGVHHRKSAESFLAMHAVVRLGAVAVPLDPTASVDYLASVVTLTGCRAILTHAPCRAGAIALGRLPGVRAVIGVDPAPHTPGTGPLLSGAAGTGPLLVADAEIERLAPRPPATVDGSDLAYLITTSGSTGTPKAIAHTHASATAHIAFMTAAYDLGPEDRISDIAPAHFDISTLALWVTPAIGAANVVVPEPHQMLPASLTPLLAGQRVSVWYSVPYLLTQLLARGGLDRDPLPALRWVLFGGEVFPPALLARLMGLLPGARFSNVYGPAEVNACTIHHLDGPDSLPTGEEPLPIGVPVADTRIRLDDLGDGRSELLVAGGTMMRGYWGRPDLDATVFSTDGSGTRWYRTGDLGWRRDDGAYVFAGRVDHQVKVRGRRIELEAVEAVLESLDGVANAVAGVVRAGSGDDVVVAGVIPRPGTVPDPAVLARQAAARLPSYAVPARFSILDDLDATLPTTGSGKLDRRSLRAAVVARLGDADNTTDTTGEGPTDR